MARAETVTKVAVVPPTEHVEPQVVVVIPVLVGQPQYWLGPEETVTPGLPVALVTAVMMADELNPCAIAY